MSQPFSKNSNNRRGSALLTVLWLTAALSAIGLAVASNVRGETERAATNVDDAKAYFIARGAVERAILRFNWGPDFHVWGDPSMRLEFPAGEALVEFIPETSKLSLNGASPEELLRLLAALGVPEDRAIEAAAAIVDWRTYPTREKPSAFDSFYLAQSPSFLPAHSSFRENEELLLVRGITPEIYYGASLDGTRAGLRDCVSVYSQGGAVDVNTARLETLMALGIGELDARTIVESRAVHPIVKYEQLLSIQRSLGPAGGRLTIGGISMYTLRATARLRRPDGVLSDMRRTVSALGRFGRDGNFDVIRWYDRF